MMDSETALELFSKQLLSYDSHVGQNVQFYYNLPYVRNYELTNSIPLTMVSGNIIKFYQYKIDKPVIIFTDVVDTTAESLGDADDETYDESMEGMDSEGYDEDAYDEDGNPRELSDDEMAALLTDDQDDEAYDKVPSGAASDEIADDDDEAYDKEPAAAPSDGDAENWQPEEF